MKFALVALAWWVCLGVLWWGCTGLLMYISKPAAFVFWCAMFAVHPYVVGSKWFKARIIAPTRGAW